MMQIPQSLDKAHQLLIHPESYRGLKIRNKSDRSLLIWSYPAFSAYCSWSLFIEQKAREQICFLRRIKWVRSVSVGSSFTVVYPYSIGSEAIIDLPQTTEIIDRFCQIKLPSLESPNTIGIDGIIYGVEITDRGIDRCFSWRSIPPEDWQPLLIWFQDSVTIFDAILPKNNISN